MCTISWLANCDGLHVRFNRDESLRRPGAIPPSVIRGGQTPFIAPIDPEGGGTWLAVSSDGTVHALLNHYEIDVPPARAPLSRGMVPFRLASGQWQLESLLESPLPLQQIRPFHLIIIQSDSVARYTWNGAQLDHTTLNQNCGCFTTSSLDPQRIMRLRLAAFDHVIATASPPHPDLLDRFHDGMETTEDPAASVLMDRDDRRTISQSRVHVGSERITYEERSRDPNGLGFLSKSCQIALSRGI